MNSNEIKIKILNMIIEDNDGHIGGSFSCVDILISLYDNILRDEDKFILSKGHAYPALYFILKEKGFNPKRSSHPDIDIENGVVCTGGSLGHGLPIGVGMAWAKKIKKEQGKIYVLISDGELEEGTTWESLIYASKYHLDNLYIIIDYNKYQALDSLEDVCGINCVENIKNKLTSFGISVIDIEGHDINLLTETIKNGLFQKNMPIAIIANTIKSKGVPFMEKDPKWHARVPTVEEYQLAMKELEK